MWGVLAELAVVGLMIFAICKFVRWYEEAKEADLVKK